MTLRSHDEISEMHYFRKYSDFWLLNDSIRHFSDGSLRRSMCCTSGEQDCCKTPQDDFNPDQFLHQNTTCITKCSQTNVDYTMEGKLREKGKKKKKFALSPGENNFYQDKQANLTKSQLQSSTNPRGTCGLKKLSSVHRPRHPERSGSQPCSSFNPLSAL